MSENSASRRDTIFTRSIKDEKTSKTDQSNDYQRMIGHWEEGKFDTVVIQDVDRLTRNYYDEVELN